MGRLRLCAARRRDQPRGAGEILRVLDTIATRHSAGTAILASHGNLIALALNAFMREVDYASWESIPTPAVFTLIRDGNGWRCTSDTH